MRSSGFGDNFFLVHAARDPIRAAEEDIRRYSIRHGVIAAPQSEPTNGRTMLCFLAIYAALGLVVVFCLFCLARLECDPFFSDRGLTTACRNHPGDMAKIIGAASSGYSGFMPSNIAQ